MAHNEGNEGPEEYEGPEGPEEDEEDEGSGEPEGHEEPEVPEGPKAKKAKPLPRGSAKKQTKRNRKPPIFNPRKLKGAKKGEGAKPCKFSAEAGQRVVDYVSAGAFVETSAAAAGISKPTFYNWLKYAEACVAKGQQNELTRWKADMDEAVATAELSLLGLVATAGSEGYWQAAAWILERKFPDRWGRRERKEITGANGGPIETRNENETTVTGILNLENMTTGELRTRRLELLAASGVDYEPDSSS